MPKHKISNQKKITDEEIAKLAKRLTKSFKKYGSAIINEDIELLKELAKH